MEIGKKLRLKPSQILFVVVLLFLAYQRLPQIFAHLQLEGKVLAPQSREIIASEAIVTYPPSGLSLTIFWATWCAPCKLEMNRLKSSVETGAIPSDRIFAISLWEEEKVVTEFLKKNSYPFTFLKSEAGDADLKIVATPTTMLVDKGVIRSLSQGMSLWGIWWIEFLFRK
jgi:cytochrome c biogenesis protein CcmG/thiol:disulfide interchange protein DsbE